MKPVAAPISHAAMMATRMPICAATIAEVGQSFCTGRRRTGLDAGFVGRDISASSWPRLSRPSTSSLAGVSKQGGDGPDIRAVTPAFDGLLPGHGESEISRMVLGLRH